MANNQVQLRRDTASNIAAIIPVDGELAYNTTNDRLHVGDGVTAGGVPHINFNDARNQTYTFLSISGTDTLTASPTPISAAYVTGMAFDFIAVATNTGGVTIAINPLGAKNIYKLQSGSFVALVAGDIVSGSSYRIIYDGTQFQLVSFGGSSSGSPSGSIIDFAGSTSPSGWLFCYGQAISRTSYAALFGVIGTDYGTGDGSTTFNIPDLRGRVSAGKDDMGGISANRLTGLSGGVNGDTLGGAGGEEAHTLTTAEMPSHSHTYSTYLGTGGGIAGTASNDAGSSTASKSTSSVGGGGAHNIIQPTIILNKIIKT